VLESHERRRSYFGGCSSLLSQPVACSVFRGSGPSQSKHWGLRCPLPSGGSARNKSAPQLGQVGRLAWPMGRILPPVPTFVKPNQARINLGLWKCSRFERNGPSVRGNAEARSEGVCPGYRHNSIIPGSAYLSRFEPVGSKLDSPDQSGNGLHGRELWKRVDQHKTRPRTRLLYLASAVPTLGHFLAASRPGTGLHPCAQIVMLTCFTYSARASFATPLPHRYAVGRIPRLSDR
jgi:hypothetical protein